MQTGEFKPVNAERVAQMVLYYYQGLRMWSRVIPFDARTAEHYVEMIREVLGIDGN